MAAYLELRRGLGTPTFMPLLPGKELTIGLRGTWCVEADDVLDVHMYVFFDGETLFLQSHDIAQPGRIARGVIGTGWVPVAQACDIEFGAATVSFVPEAPDSQDDTTAIFDGPAVELPSDAYEEVSGVTPGTARIVLPTVTRPPSRSSSSLPPPERPPLRAPLRTERTSSSGFPNDVHNAYHLSDQGTGNTKLNPLVAVVSTASASVRPAAGARLSRSSAFPGLASSVRPPSEPELDQPAELDFERTQHAPLESPTGSQPRTSMLRRSMGNLAAANPEFAMHLGPGVPRNQGALMPGQSHFAGPFAYPQAGALGLTGAQPLHAASAASKPRARAAPLAWFVAQSIPRKASILLAPFACFAAFQLLFPSEPDAAPGASSGPLTAQPAQTQAPAVPAVVPTEPGPMLSAPPIGPIGTTVASSATARALVPQPGAPAAPSAHPVTSSSNASSGASVTLERRAADAYAQGRIEEAAQAYEKLARESPTDRALAEIARILKQRARTP
jgi:hypothetical protein